MCMSAVHDVCIHASVHLSLCTCTHANRKYYSSGVCHGKWHKNFGEFNKRVVSALEAH